MRNRPNECVVAVYEGRMAWPTGCNEDLTVNLSCRKVTVCSHGQVMRSLWSLNRFAWVSKLSSSVFRSSCQGVGNNGRRNDSQ